MLNGGLPSDSPERDGCPPPTPQCSYERTCGVEAALAAAVSAASAIVTTESKQSNPDDFDADIEALASQLRTFDWKEDVANSARKMLESQTLEDNLAGVMRFKKMLCIARQHVFKVADDVIRAGVLPRLVAFVASDKHFDLKLASAFCLTNVAAGDDAQTDSVVEAGAIPVLMDLLEHPNQQLRRQAIFCLANIAGSTAENRRRLLAEPNYCRRVMISAEICRDTKIEAIAAWNLRNMCVLPGFNLPAAEYAVRYFAEFICDSRDPMTHWNREFSDIERYACEALVAVCSSKEGRAHTLELVPSVPDACVRAVGFTGTPQARFLYLDVLHQICRGGVYGKNAVFAATGDLVLCSILRNRANPYKLRHRALEILNVLTEGEICPVHAARLFTSGPQMPLAFLPTSSAQGDSGGVVGSPVFSFAGVPGGVAGGLEGGGSPVDVCLDVCFQRGGAEDPVLRQTAALFVCRVVRHAPLECLASHARVEEVLGLVLDVLDCERGHEVGMMMGEGAVSPGGPAGMMGGDGGGEHHTGDDEMGGDDSTANYGKGGQNGTEKASQAVVDALCAMERLMDVGQRVGQSRGLGANPVVAMLEQLGAATRLRDLLRRTQSLLVSEKVVAVLSRDFSFASMPQ